MKPFFPRLAYHLSALLRLAWPVMLSRAGILIMALTDIVMLGHYGFGAVGISNLGLSTFVPSLVLAIGLCSGMVPVISTAYGAGAWTECGRAWRRALVWGFVLAMFGTWVILQAESILLFFGQTPEMAAGGGSVATALAPGLVAQVLFAVSAFYMESTGRPRVAMLAMLVANLVNLTLNWVLIYGNLGLPEMGAVGAAIASTIARYAAFGMMLWAILGQSNPVAAGVRGPWETFWGPGGWRAGYQMRRLGFSAGLSNGFEVFGFAAMTLFAGILGSQSLEAYSIIHNIMSTVFMIGLGLSIATGVRVGTEMGRGHPDEAAFAGWTGLVAAILIMGLMGLLTWAGRYEIAAFYASDPAVIERAAGLCLIVALVYMPDSCQIVLGQAVRALGDAWIPILCYIVSFSVLMVPLGWILSMYLGFEERGLLMAIITSCWLATLLLGWRFRVLTRRAR
ncbi:MATE family efflux transporter [Rhodobacteraceae bacterium NNCM2]|nr:MATE family efflux transporter [Coraliihabitans acroporae]